MTSKEKENLGITLKRLRLANSYTLEEVAERLNITHKSVQFWEQGKNEIKLSKLIQLAQLYKTTIDKILEESGIK